MGQKANPNSFNIQRKDNNNKFNSFDLNTNYSFLYKEIFLIRNTFIQLFENQNFLVKDCYFVLNVSSLKIYFYISFLPLFLNLKKSKKNIKQKNYLKMFIKILNFYNFKSYKKIFIFKNLSYCLFKKKFQFYFTNYFKIFKFYNKENYFSIGQIIFFYLKTATQGEILLAKFISYFLKKYHRRKKTLNKFFRFLTLFLHFLYKYKIVKGVKIQIKGRLRGIPRSKKFTFQKGSIPLQTIACSINYCLIHVPTRYGLYGLKVWIYK